MHSVVLIEDEYWTLRGLLATFPWEEHNMEVLQSYTDSTAALEFILQSRPDIVITDIEMPGMSGIELVTQIRNHGINSKVVILSAYSNFNYAQELIKQGIFEYCLKPLNRQNAESILSRLQASLENYATTTVSVPKNDDVLTNNTRFNKLVAYVNENYSEKLILNELCQTFGLNPDYCNKLFLQHFSCNYSNYLKTLRMEKASQLLQQDLTIAEVASQTGYPDYFYFIKVFKKHFGITPYQYKNNQTS